MATQLIQDDLSSNFNDIAARLKHPSGLAYREFRKSLKPNYPKIWRDILLGHAGLIVTAVLLASLPLSGWLASLASILVGTFVFGYLHQYLSLFMHEAAHFNIAATRLANDRLTNLFLGILQGYSIQAYRPKHFDHHRDLGLPEDPEHHYFHALDWRFFVLTLSGTRTFIEIWQRLFGAGNPVPAANGKPAPSAVNWVVIAGGLLHGTIVIGSIWTGRWQLGVAWTLGFLIGFPFFSMLRQILEHRDFDAAPDADFAKVSHGGITRIFGDGPVAGTLGAAGFNRHLLHHWEPQVSYTRLPELEQFLLETEAGPIIRARQETYLSTLRKLLH